MPKKTNSLIRNPTFGYLKTLAFVLFSGENLFFKYLIENCSSEEHSLEQKFRNRFLAKDSNLEASHGRSFVHL